MGTTRRIRIVYILGTLDVGGTEKQVVETAIRLNRDRFHPLVYCFSDGGPLADVLTAHGIEVTLLHEAIQPALSLSRRLKRYFRKFWSLLQYIRHTHPDIVHSYLFSPAIFGGLTATLAHVPVVIASRRCLGSFKDEKVSFQFLEDLVNRVTDGVLVNSEALRSDVLFRETIPAEKVHVIYNGLDVDAYRPARASGEFSTHQLKQQWNIPVSSPVVGIVANLIPYKGHQDFLMAAATVLQHIPDTQIVCVGEDRGILAQLEQLCETLCIRDHVVFTGHIPSVAKILPVFDVQVSASHEEGFSNAILEGMATERPIVATAVGGTPEAVLHGITGLLVPPHAPDELARAILQILKSPHMAARFGKNGRLRVKNCFSMEKMIDKLENVYSTFLQSAHVFREKDVEKKERI